MYGLLARSALAIAVVGVFVARAGAADVVNGAGTTHHCRISHLEEMQVRNASGEDLGKIKDVVIDVKSGKIAYAALDFGGFLGIGDKLFAVPWSALTVNDTAKDHKDHFFVLNVTKEKLKDAPGFDKNHWPDMANPNWSSDVDRFYGTPRTASTVR